MEHRTRIQLVQSLASSKGDRSAASDAVHIQRQDVIMSNKRKMGPCGVGNVVQRVGLGVSGTGGRMLDEHIVVRLQKADVHVSRRVYGEYLVATGGGICVVPQLNREIFRTEVKSLGFGGRVQSNREIAAVTVEKDRRGANFRPCRVVLRRNTGASVRCDRISLCRLVGERRIFVSAVGGQDQRGVIVIFVSLHKLRCNKQGDTLWIILRGHIQICIGDHVDRGWCGITDRSQYIEGKTRIVNRLRQIICDCEVVLPHEIIRGIQDVDTGTIVVETEATYRRGIRRVK